MKNKRNDRNWRFRGGKLLSLSLAVMLLLTALAACSGDGSKPADTTAAPTAGTTAPTATAATAPDADPATIYTAPDVDYNGREFLFSSWKTSSPNWIATSYFECEAENLNGDIINDAIYTRNRKVEEALGVTIKAIEYSSTSQMINATAAGDHFADTVLFEGLTVGSTASQGLFRDLQEIPTLDLRKVWWDQNAMDAYTINGKLYFVPGNIGTFGELAVYCTFFNKEMMKNFGLGDPYAMVREGKWTLEQMELMAQAVGSDLNNDGRMDDNDRFGLASEPNFSPVALRAANVKFVQKNEDDLPELVIDAEQVTGALERIIPMFRNPSYALYSQDFSGAYKNVFAEFITPMFINENLLFLNNWMCVALELRGMEADFGILPPCKFDESQERYLVPSSESWTYYATVPLTVKDEDLDFVGHVMDALGYYGREEVHTALIEETITYKTVRDADTEEMLNIIYDNRYYDLESVFEWGVSKLLRSMINDNRTNFASSYSQMERVFRATIENTNKQYTE